jgi:hypothetical protein
MLQKRGHDELFESVKGCLQVGDWRSLRDYGEFYVYQVGDWYEVDFELTSILEGHVLLLARAALSTGCKLPCRLVEPKSRRRRRFRAKASQCSAAGAKDLRLGQLRFDDLLHGWCT